MKKLLFVFLGMFLCFDNSLLAQYEIKIVTSVESIVPGGLGRSRIIENNGDVNAEDLTTERTDGKDSKQGNKKRSDAKIDELKETKLVNFYSLTGINFQNIASNDAIISSKINNLISEGWDLVFVTSAAESDAGKSDGDGIFITRYFFKKKK